MQKDVDCGIDFTIFRGETVKWRDVPSTYGVRPY